MQKVVFTDLDGTLLDHDTYSFKKALPALSLLEEKKIPLIICTSKTKAETEFYRKNLKNNHPFISENGGAIFIPKNYFDFPFKYTKKDRKYYIIGYGAEYKELRKIFCSIRKIKKLEMNGFGDMAVKEVSKDSCLSLKEARLAKKRDYIEPFKFKGNLKVLKSVIKGKKLNYGRGANYHCLMGKNDKGKAVRQLARLYKRKFKSIRTIALGDNLNDIAMLKEVDNAYLVQKRDGSYENNKFKHAKGIGPDGWNKIILKIIDRK